MYTFGEESEVALGIGGLGASQAAVFGDFGTLSVAGRPTASPAPASVAGSAAGSLTQAAHTPFTAILKIDGTGPEQGAIRFTLTDGSAVAAAGDVFAKILAPSAPRTVAKIVSTVKNLAVASVYPAPVFSFHA